MLFANLTDSPILEHFYTVNFIRDHYECSLDQHSTLYTDLRSHLRSHLFCDPRSFSDHLQCDQIGDHQIGIADLIADLLGSPITCLVQAIMPYSKGMMIMDMNTLMCLRRLGESGRGTLRAFKFDS